MTSPYFPPPDDYEPPTRCLTCDDLVMFGPVLGGHIWMHVPASMPRDPSDTGHAAEVGRWWDVRTGQWREGSGLEEILAAAATAESQLGQTRS
jgi:hypothetical protein